MGGKDACNRVYRGVTHGAKSYNSLITVVIHNAVKRPLFRKSKFPFKVTHLSLCYNYQLVCQNCFAYLFRVED
ncbi:hypothetical protein TcWFU_009379 [Taenia crassiceps]|uniref:Uncharacterized protein n=1 Tax=Taenia crassiceps TaxID=6207 RepID=A0ABR4QTN5_9CEST